MVYILLLLLATGMMEGGYYSHLISTISLSPSFTNGPDGFVT